MLLNNNNNSNKKIKFKFKFTVLINNYILNTITVPNQEKIYLIQKIKLNLIYYYKNMINIAAARDKGVLYSYTYIYI